MREVVLQSALFDCYIIVDCTSKHICEQLICNLHFWQVSDSRAIFFNYMWLCLQRFRNILLVSIYVKQICDCLYWLEAIRITKIRNGWGLERNIAPLWPFWIQLIRARGPELGPVNFPYEQSSAFSKFQ